MLSEEEALRLTNIKKKFNYCILKVILYNKLKKDLNTLLLDLNIYIKCYNTMLNDKYVDILYNKYKNEIKTINLQLDSIMSKYLVLDKKLYSILDKETIYELLEYINDLILLIQNIKYVNIQFYLKIFNSYNKLISVLINFCLLYNIPSYDYTTLTNIKYLSNLNYYIITILNNNSSNTIASNTVASNTIASNTIARNTIASNTVASNTIASNTIVRNTIARNTVASNLRIKANCILYYIFNNINNAYGVLTISSLNNINTMNILNITKLFNSKLIRLCIKNYFNNNVCYDININSYKNDNYILSRTNTDNKYLLNYLIDNCIILKTCIHNYINKNTNIACVITEIINIFYNINLLNYNTNYDTKLLDIENNISKNSVNYICNYMNLLPPITCIELLNYKPSITITKTIKSNTFLLILSIGNYKIYLDVYLYSTNNKILLNSILINNYNLLKTHIFKSFNFNNNAINFNIKKKIIDLLTIKNIIFTETNIYDSIVRQIYDVSQIINNNDIINIMNEFLNKKLEDKATFINILLLINSTDTKFISSVLWDLIKDENDYSDTNLANNICKFIHPDLMYLIEDNEYHFNTNNTFYIDDEPLSYERKIELLNISKENKQKAYDKLKELNNKGSDNNNKAIQYLEGFIKIPFNKYIKEEIIQINDTFILNIINFIKYIIIHLLQLIGTDKQIPYSINTFIYKYIITYLDIKLKLNIIPITFINNITPYIITLYNDILDTKYDFDLIYKLYTLLNDIHIHDTIEVLISDNNAKNTWNNIHIKKLHIIELHTILNFFYNLDILKYKTHLDTKTHLDNGNNLSIELFNKDIIKDLCIQSENIINEYSVLNSKKTIFLDKCLYNLDTSIYGQNDAKNQIIRIISQWINGNQSGYVLGFEGAPGLGKTSLAKYGISKALEDIDGTPRPFGFIPIGGSSNGSLLEGHLYTYVSSTWGRIVDILMNSKCMNPIIFIDELDKISKTENGRELIGIFTHLTDRTQNNEFMDKYFAGVKIDLSKVLFIFSYNDYSLLDRILADRIHRIKFNNYTLDDKINICKLHIIPSIENEINILEYNIDFCENVLKYLIINYTHEAGVRKLKEKLYDIYREINIITFSNTSKLTIKNNTIIITEQLIDTILLDYHKINFITPYDKPMVGIVYGLYATSSGIGGITIIQVTNKFTDIGGSLLLTGKQGDIMKESMNVSLTCSLSKCSYQALNKFDLQLNNITTYSNTDDINIDNINTSNDNSIIDDNNKTNNDTTYVNTDVNNTIKDNGGGVKYDKINKKKLSLHIHCPDNATPKDGPSAGCAITIGIISIIENKPISNKYSMTGEIDIKGNVLPIGGLSSKILGSKNSGIYNVIIPRKNIKDLEYIKDKQPQLLDDMNIIMVDTIDDIMKYVF